MANLPPLKIKKPFLPNENNTDGSINNYKDYIEHLTKKQKKNNSNNENENVWEVPLNIFNVEEFRSQNERYVPIELERNISWANKPPQTPKSKPPMRLEPPKLLQKAKTRPRYKNNTRKIKRNRRSTRKNRR